MDAGAAEQASSGYFDDSVSGLERRPSALSLKFYVNESRYAKILTYLRYSLRF